MNIPEATVNAVLTGFGCFVVFAFLLAFGVFLDPWCVGFLSLLICNISNIIYELRHR